VALCPAVDCPSWPFRMGTDPWRRPASETREAARRMMTNLNARRRERDGAKPAASPPEHGTAPLFSEDSEATPNWDTARVDLDPETEKHRPDGSLLARPLSNSRMSQLPLAATRSLLVATLAKGVGVGVGGSVHTQWVLWHCSRGWRARRAGRGELLVARTGVGSG